MSTISNFLVRVGNNQEVRLAAPTQYMRAVEVLTLKIRINHTPWLSDLVFIELDLPWNLIGVELAALMS